MAVDMKASRFLRRSRRARPARFRFSDGEAERFFAEHMLAGLGGADVQEREAGWQRVVDGVDVGSATTVLGAVGRGNAQRRRGLLRRGQIARGDRADGGVLPALLPGITFLRPIAR